MSDFFPQSVLRACKGLRRRTAAALLCTAAFASVAAAQSYAVNNILSDGSVPATATDPNFINPWGVSSSSNFWISAAGSGFNYVFPPAGPLAFKVIVPLGAQPTQAGLPAGAVSTASSTGFLLPNGAAPNFFFSTLDGTISGWNAKLGTNNAVSQIVINNSGNGATYAGLALLNTANGSFLLAPNFTGGTVEVYNSNYQAAKLAGSFTDPNLPSGYSPFGIHILGSQIFVTYAQKPAQAPFKANIGPGLGVVDSYDLTGNFKARVATGGNLDAPWGVAIAPASFGIFSNDLLIGNQGDGKINVYDPATFAYQGQLFDATGKSLAYANLWELLPGGTPVSNGTSSSGGDKNTVFFTAGLDSEKHGLLAGITSAAASGSATFGFSTGAGAVSVPDGTSANIPLSIASVNGFTGSVSLSCSGLPQGATCSFAPAQLNVASTTPTLGTVTITTTAAHASLLKPSTLRGSQTASLLAFGLPVFSLALLGSRRRLPSAAIRLMGLGCIVVLMGLVVTGCGDSGNSQTPTPAGTANVVVTATAGAISQQSTVAVTVQ